MQVVGYRVRETSTCLLAILDLLHCEVIPRFLVEAAEIEQRELRVVEQPLEDHFPLQKLVVAVDGALAHLPPPPRDQPLQCNTEQHIHKTP